MTEETTLRECSKHDVHYSDFLPCPFCQKEKLTYVLPFTEKDIKAYLDKVIRHWRMCDSTPEMRAHYIDAYQSVRTSIFGDCLPVDPEPPESETVNEASDIKE